MDLTISQTQESAFTPSPPGGRMIVLLAAALAFQGCGSATPPGPAPAVPDSAPAEPPPAKPIAAPESPTPEPEPEPCAANPEGELPVGEGEIGSGPRVVRIINTSSVEIRARLVDGKGQAVLGGTLRVPAGESGTFRVDAGTFVVRYRLESSCQVYEGSPVRLTGPRAGVEIALSAIFNEGSSHGVRPIQGEL